MSNLPQGMDVLIKKFEEETGYAAPDFNTLRSMAYLPPLLEFYEGKPVENQEDWEKRSEEIKRLLCYYFVGNFPQEVPSITQAATLSEAVEGKTVKRKVKLTYDTKNKASIEIEILRPEGKGPFPVFLTQASSKKWALLALSRGYMVCAYPGDDMNDQTEVFKEAYPECDWSLMARRAWLGSRALDYILTLPEADKEKVAITGHSRNGKQSMVAAAFDERIKAVVSASSGAGGACPSRFVSENAFSESVEFMTRSFPSWFHPRLRLFTGRENKLPIDTHGFLGLIAPRHCLFSTAYNDGAESPYAVERCYLAGKELYKFLGKPEALSLKWRNGEHGIAENDVQTYIDYFDTVFGKGNTEFPEELLYNLDWESWRSQNSESEIPVNVKDKRELIKWGLGEQPAVCGDSGVWYYGAEPQYISSMMGREAGMPEDVTRVPVSFSEYFGGSLYYKRDTEGPMPVVIWLHPYNHPKGYTGTYIREKQIYYTLAQQGYMVLTFDMIGFGTRILEGKDFYKRYPRWSRLGKMVNDVQCAVNLIKNLPEVSAMLKSFKIDIPAERVDTNKIFCLGYSLGGLVAMYAAALDERISGVATFSGFTPMRTETASKGTGGLERLYRWHSLQPVLGFYKGREEELPYDFDDVLTLVAPRPCLIVSPRHDREADASEVAACVDKVKQELLSQAKAENITCLCPDDYNRFQEEQQNIFIDWIKNLI